MNNDIANVYLSLAPYTFDNCCMYVWPCPSLNPLYWMYVTILHKRPWFDSTNYWTTRQTFSQNWKKICQEHQTIKSWACIVSLRFVSSLLNRQVHHKNQIRPMLIHRPAALVNFKSKCATLTTVVTLWQTPLFIFGSIWYLELHD